MQQSAGEAAFSPCPDGGDAQGAHGGGGRLRLARFRDLSIGLKCLIGPTLSVVALAIIAWVVLNTTEKLQLADSQYELAREQAHLILNARSEIERSNSGVYRAITWQASNVPAADIERTVAGVAESLQQGQERLDKLAGYGGRETVVQNIDDIRGQLDLYKEAVDQVIDLLEEDYFLSMMFLNGAEAHYEKLDALLAEAALNAEAASRERRLATTEIISSSLLLTLTAIAIEFAATSLVGFGLARAISGPILSLVATLERLRAGDLDLQVPHISRRDEIGRVAQAVMDFRDNLRRTRALEQSQREAEEVMRQKQEAELALQREREVNGLQRQFISMVSHEFRTPLAVIDSCAQRLQRRPEKATPERLADVLGRIRKSVSLLIELMESVLSTARLEEGRIEFQPAACALRDLVDEVCASYREANKDRAILVDLGRLPETIRADRRLLRQVISNLISNAVKYSPAGSTVEVIASRGRNGEAVIAVRDEGVGIPEEDLGRLFERFFRASTSTGIPGSGIGLHLVKHFVEMHGGRIGVASVAGEGTTFTLHLPAEAHDGRLETVGDSESPAQARA